MSETTPAENSAGTRGLRVWLRRCGWFVLGLSVFLLCLPTVLSHTPLRNVLLQWLAGPRTQATTQSASFGWFTSPHLQGLGIVDVGGGGRIDVQRVGTEKSLLSLIVGSPDLGKLFIAQPRLDLVVSLLPVRPASTSQKRATFRAEVQDVAVVLRDKPDQPPLIDIANLDVTVQVSREAGGRVLTVEPTQLLSEQELTVDMCHRGLQLIAPVLANAANVDGKVSLRLDKMRVSLDQSSSSGSRTEIDGHLVLHRVSAGLRNPLLKEIARALVALRVEMPSQVKLADEADVHFFVRDGRIFHEGLAFGLPEVSPDLVLRTSGSVGMDRSLDMLVDVPVPLDMLRDGPVMRMLSERPLQLQVRGTLDKPLVSLPADRPWYKELADRLGVPSDAPSSTGPASAVEAVEPLAEAILGTVGNLLERRRQKAAGKAKSDSSAKSDESTKSDDDAPAATPLLDRLRTLRDGRRKRSEP